MLTTFNPPLFSVALITCPAFPERIKGLYRAVDSLLAHVRCEYPWEIVASVETDCPAPLVAEAIEYLNDRGCRVVGHSPRKSIPHNQANAIAWSASPFVLMMQDDFYLTADLRVADMIGVFATDPKCAAIFISHSNLICTKWQFDPMPSRIAKASAWSSLEGKLQLLSPESTYYYSDAAHIRGPLFMEELGVGDSPAERNSEWIVNTKAKVAAEDGLIRFYGMLPQICEHDVTMPRCQAVGESPAV